MTITLSTRRARRPDSLASSVSTVLREMQCPVSTTAIRIILNDRGRPTTAEHLGRLAAYQRQDFDRTHVPPPLCWSIEPDGAATVPRCWAMADWRLGRRIHTRDAAPVWLEHLAVWLTADLADHPDGRSEDIVHLALGTVARLNGPRVFQVPSSSDDWMQVRASVYSEGRMSNRTGLTRGQEEAEARLQRSGVPGLDLLFGAPNH